MIIPYRVIVNLLDRVFVTAGDANRFLEEKIGIKEIRHMGPKTRRRLAKMLSRRLHQHKGRW